MQLPGELAALSLRERKKARTRAAIQRHALRLFREQGYEATTISQIAEAAEVSESTFFRYFPSKEEVVIWDEFDPRFVDLFREQPADLGPVAAMRNAIREVLTGLTPEQEAAVHERIDLMLTVPELRQSMIAQMAMPMRLVAELVAERSGRSPDEPAVYAIAGAIIGVSFSAMFAFIDRPGADMAAMLDEALGCLEAGLPL